jgi:hypothetical protein
MPRTLLLLLILVLSACATRIASVHNLSRIGNAFVDASKEGIAASRLSGQVVDRQIMDAPHRDQKGDWAHQEFIVRYAEGSEYRQTQIRLVIKQLEAWEKQLRIEAHNTLPDGKTLRDKRAPL